jgi:hypothetical protein
MIVLRSNIFVTVYGAIRPYTEENGDCIRPPCTKTVSDRFFLRIAPYVSVYDTEIYDRNTITCKPSYSCVYVRLRPCLFELGTKNYSIYKYSQCVVCLRIRLMPCLGFLLKIFNISFFLDDTVVTTIQHPRPRTTTTTTIFYSSTIIIFSCCWCCRSIGWSRSDSSFY